MSLDPAPQDASSALAAINAFAEALRGVSDTPQTLRLALRHIAQCLGVEECAITLLDPTGQRAQRVICHPASDNEPSPDPSEWGLPPAAPRFPLMIQGRMIGILRVGPRQAAPALSPKEAALAQTLANQLAIALERNQLLAESRDAGALYQALFEGVDEGILVADEQGRYRAANPAACALLGYSREELLNCTTRDLLAHSAGPLASYYRERLSEGGFRAEFDLRHKDGSVVPVEITASGVTVNGETLFVGIQRDLSTLRKTEAQLRQRLAQLEALYLTSLELTAQLNVGEALQAIVERAVNLLNGTAGALYLYDAQEGVLTLTVIHRLGPARLGLKLRPGEGAAGQVWVRGEPLSIPDYTRFPHAHAVFAHQQAAVLAVPLRGREGIIGVIEVTDRRTGRAFSDQDIYLLDLFAHYATIAINQARLFEETRHTAEALSRANRDLRELDRMKDNFLAMVTHELRRPLTEARLGIEHLLSDPTGQLSAPQRNTLTLALKGVDEQSQLVDDLLFLLRLREPQQVFPVPLDLCHMVRNAMLQVGAQMQEKGLTLVAELPSQPVPLQADPTHLEKMLASLLTNAAKFTPPGGAIRVALALEDSQVVISVQDSGIGIPLEYQQRIFERFAQADNGHARDYEGLGLGLALVKEIVAEYHGRITLTSREGQGSTFQVQLPLTPSG